MIGNFSDDSIKKVRLGQFFTKACVWLQPQVKSFILSTGQAVAYDPFAGGGDLLQAAKNDLNFKQVVGFDIDEALPWQYNDSLVEIPHIDNAVIITNPPYLAKQSCSRKKLDCSKYFKNTPYDDLYLLALDKMLQAQKYVVAIIPESFINSRFTQKSRLDSITILEGNPFEDTENPVCVACFDNRHKAFDEIRVYKNSVYVNDLQTLSDFRLYSKKNLDIRFNDLDGWLALRAVDSTDPDNTIKFDFKENVPYDWQKNIKVSSRHITLISVDVAVADREEFVRLLNGYIYEIRAKSKDVILTPFKGNMKNGVRRRRLDFSLARAIIEEAYNQLYNPKFY